MHSDQLFRFRYALENASNSEFMAIWISLVGEPPTIVSDRNIMIEVLLECPDIVERLAKRSDRVVVPRPSKEWLLELDQEQSCPKPAINTPARRATDRASLLNRDIHGLLELARGFAARSGSTGDDSLRRRAS